MLAARSSSSSTMATRLGGAASKMRRLISWAWRSPASASGTTFQWSADSPATATRGPMRVLGGACGPSQIEQGSATPPRCSVA